MLIYRGYLLRDSNMLIFLNQITRVLIVCGGEMFRVLIYGIAFLILNFNVFAEPIRVVTEDLAPLNYLEGDQLKGSAVTKVKKVLNDLEYEADIIQVLPWNRAYDMALHEKNVLIFSMARFEKRENLFRWIGVIEDFDMWVYCKNNGKQHEYEDEESIKNLSVGLQNYIKPFFDLNSRGYTNIVPIKGYEHGLKMLDTERMDIIIAPRKVMEAKLKELNYPENQFVECLHLNEISTTLYLAMSKSSSPELVEKFRQSWQKHYPND